MTTHKFPLLKHCHLILAFASSLRRGVRPVTESAEQMRDIFVGLFRAFERAADEDRYSAEDLRDAKYAMTAYVDETFGTLNDWQGQASYMQNPMTHMFFGEMGFGLRFFDILTGLQRLSEQRRDVLEVYFTCLALGYVGKYFLEGENARRVLIEDIGRVLHRAQPESTELAPAAYPPNEYRRRSAGVKSWVVWAFAIGTLLLIYGGFRLAANRAADNTRSNILKVNGLSSGGTSD